jgi:hypothetical protein
VGLKGDRTVGGLKKASDIKLSDATSDELKKANKNNAIQGKNKLSTAKKEWANY